MKKKIISLKNNKKPNINYLYPSKDEKIIAKLSNPNYEGGSLVITEESSILDRTKYEFCQAIARCKREKKLESSEVADLLSLDEITTNKLLRCHVEAFALDSLISYAEKLNISCQIKITPEKSLSLIRKSNNNRTRKHL